MSTDTTATLRPPRPVPEVTEETRHHWSGGSEAGWMLLRCPQCSTWSLPPAPLCVACRSATPVAQTASGHGHVVSWTINHQAWVPGMAVPFVVVLVELAEQSGLRMLTDLVELDGSPVRTADELSVGDKTTFLFESIAADVWLPQATLVAKR